jgi:hypothetical protein
MTVDDLIKELTKLPKDLVIAKEHSDGLMHAAKSVKLHFVEPEPLLPDNAYDVTAYDTGIKIVEIV